MQKRVTSRANYNSPLEKFPNPAGHSSRCHLNCHHLIVFYKFLVKNAQKDPTANKTRKNHLAPHDLDIILSTSTQLYIFTDHCLIPNRPLDICQRIQNSRKTSRKPGMDDSPHTKNDRITFPNEKRPTILPPPYSRHERCPTATHENPKPKFQKR